MGSVQKAAKLLAALPTSMGRNLMELETAVFGRTARAVATSAPDRRKDPCLPPPMPPESMPCEDKKKPRPPCVMPKPIKWCPCEKVCMPCCKVAPAPPDCEEPILASSNCQRPEYRYPSFSECKKKPLTKRYRIECCFYQRLCPRDRVGREARKPFKSVRERTDHILGRHREDCASGKKGICTSAVVLKDDKSCKKTKVGLPCVKPSEILGGKKPSPSKKGCEKLCMPCCAPARDPPECFFPYVKPPCKKHKPPRPAYSECKKDPVDPQKPCECQLPRAKLCDKGSKKK